MSTYTCEIEGKYDLEQINLQIAREEATAAEFVQSTISFYNGHITNLAELKDIESGIIPKALRLVKHGSAAPAGTVQVWSGVMIVENQNQVVTAYRST